MACVALVATGSFNPPTFMHLRMFGLLPWGLISAEHRVQLCNMACKSFDFTMVDSWEASQMTWQRTLAVLSRIKGRLSHKVPLSCGKQSVGVLMVLWSFL